MIPIQTKTAPAGVKFDNSFFPSAKKGRWESNLFFPYFFKAQSGPTQALGERSYKQLSVLIDYFKSI